MSGSPNFATNAGVISRFRQLSEKHADFSKSSRDWLKVW
jgi:hypothetical protein